MFAIPLVSLVGLWGFAASVTVNGAITNHNFSSTSQGISSKGAPLSLEVTTERAQTYLWLISGRKASKAPLLATRKLVDEAITAGRTALSAGTPTSGEARATFNAFFGALGQLGSIRAAADGAATSPAATFQAYSGILDAQFRYYYSTIEEVGATQIGASIGIADAAYALEMANRETVLVNGALAGQGRLSPGVQQLFTSAAANRRLLMNDIAVLLPPDMATPYVSIESSAQYRLFQAMEDRIIAASGSNAPIPVTAAAWQSASAAYLGAMLNAELSSASQLGATSASVSDRLVVEAILAGGVGLGVVVGSVFLLTWFGRKITGDLTGLHDSVRAMAEERLPHVVQRLRQGDDVDVLAESPPPPASTIREISQIAGSFATVQEAAVAAAVDQARLRTGIGRVFLNISMRNQSLLHRQLELLDTMERHASGPEALADLFRLDHLTTRMRRHAEGLIILSGAIPGRGWRDPVPVVDVLRAAVAEVEDYVRVDVVSESLDLVAGKAVNDIIHLVAELVENATVFSPPNTRIEIRADRVGTGLVAEIEDRGLGLSEEELAEINRRLASPPEFDPGNSEQLGLFVVSRLAARHAVQVTLRRSAFGGTTAILLLPFGLIVQAEDAHAFGPPASSPVSAPASRHRRLAAASQRTAELQGSAEPQGLMEPQGSAERPGSAEWQGSATAGGQTQTTDSPGPPAPTAAAAPEAPAMTPWPMAFQPQSFRREPSQPSGPASAGSHLGMPVRVPQASLAPQLRTGSGTAPQPAARESASVSTRSPEATRSMLILMQRGWQRGRVDDIEEHGDVPGDGTD
jgi:signal transduction histidine kinase